MTYETTKSSSKLLEIEKFLEREVFALLIIYSMEIQINKTSINW